MERKCPYCGSTIDEKSQYCHICGTPLDVVQNKLGQKPQTIEELQAWYTDHHLPPEEVTRFFIGKNILEPKAFGVYKNEVGEFVVYKNKASGERAIRYQGMDEAFAVGEILQKLRDEMAEQRARQRARKANAQQSDRPRATYATSTEESSGSSGIPDIVKMFGFAVAFIVGCFFFVSLNHVPNGYYKYQNIEYFLQGSTWYKYNSASDTWQRATEPMSKYITSDNADQYRFYGHQGTRFESTEWYDDGSSSDNSSYDDDWDDDDDWDSGSTDWDSDW